MCPCKCVLILGHSIKQKNKVPRGDDFCLVIMGIKKYASSFANFTPLSIRIKHLLKINLFMLSVSSEDIISRNLNTFAAGCL